MRWRQRVRRGGLYIVVAAALSAQAGCSSNDNGTDWEEVTTYEATKGVITTLEETEPGKFTIIDEQVASSRADSRIIIRRLGGTVDTMTLDQAKGLVQAADTVTQQVYRHHSHGLGHALWWGSMGYMMGRSFSSPVNSSVYSPTSPMARTGYGANLRQELRSTAVSRTEFRPAKARSGFFRSFRGSSGG